MVNNFHFIINYNVKLFIISHISFDICNKFYIIISYLISNDAIKVITGMKCFIKHILCELEMYKFCYLFQVLYNNENFIIFSQILNYLINRCNYRIIEPVYFMDVNNGSSWLLTSLIFIDLQCK